LLADNCVDGLFVGRNEAERLANHKLLFKIAVESTLNAERKRNWV